MSQARSFTFLQGLAAASVAAVVIVMLAPLRPGSPLEAGRREASMIPLLAANGLADSGAFHRLRFQPALCASEEPQFIQSTSEQTGDRRLRVVTVRKKVLPLEVDLHAPRVEWKHLSTGVRNEIDLGSERGREIHAVVLHGSGGVIASNSRGLSRLHRWILGSASGVGYDFVIGDAANPSSIRSGDRWRQSSDDDDALRICISGDFETVGPSPGQLEALNELIDYLKIRLGHLRVTTQAQEAGRPVSCMGQGFPESAILEALNSRR